MIERSDVLEKSQSVDQKKKKNYMTKKRAEKKAGKLDVLPERILAISIGLYCYAISLRKNKGAYIVLNDESMEIPDMLILQYIYGIFLYKYEDDIDTEDPDDISQEWNQKEVTFFLPDFVKKIGKKKIKEVLEEILKYRDLVGIIPGNKSYGTMEQRFPVIDHYDYDADYGIITISSPYIMVMLKKVEKARIDKKNKYPKTYRGSYLPAGYSRRVYPEIIGERSKKAAEVVIAVATLIDRAGDPVKRDKAGNPIVDENEDPVIDESRVAHIKVQEIINRCSKFNVDYHATERTTSKNAMLKRVFERVWEILPEYTDLEDVYKNIELPDPKNEKFIPTSSRLKEVLQFPHCGKI